MEATQTLTNRYGFPLIECDRCQGRGYMGEYANVFGGECFKCGGTKYMVKPGKAAKAWKAFKEACDAAQAATFADLKEGDKFTAPGIAGWAIYSHTTPNLNEGYLTYHHSKGTLGTKPEWACKINRPLPDPAPFTKGL